MTQEPKQLQEVNQENINTVFKLPDKQKIQDKLETYNSNSRNKLSKDFMFTTDDDDTFFVVRKKESTLWKQVCNILNKKDNLTFISRILQKIKNIFKKNET